MESHTQLALQAAIEASKKIMSVRKGDYSIELKSDDSPVTDADEAAHSVIKKHLVETPFPVLSEEGKKAHYEIRKDWEKLWIVDPLDGTRAFINGRNEFTVNIALVENGIPILGVIAIPVEEKVYWASTGNGAFRAHFSDLKNTTRLPDETGNHPYRVTVSRTHLEKRTQAFVDDLRSDHPDLKLVKSASALKFCILADGLADCYPRFSPCMEWDTAAGQILLTETGKELIDLATGKPMVYNRKNLKNGPFIAR